MMYWDGDESAIYAESLLAGFLRDVGGGQLSLPVVLPLVETLLNSPEWHHHRCALSLLEQCLVAAPVSFAPHIPVALEAALKLAESVSPRVQFQALSLLGVICEQDSDKITRKQHGTRILQAMSRLVGSGVSKVSALACVALVSYCRGGGDDNERAELVVPYLPELLNVLVSGPLSASAGRTLGVLTTQVRAIGVVACLAEAAGEEFGRYYGDVVPILASLTETPSTQYEASRLRGAAVEAVTIIGQSLGESQRK